MTRINPFDLPKLTKPLHIACCACDRVGVALNEFCWCTRQVCIDCMVASEQLRDKQTCPECYAFWETDEFDDVQLQSAIKLSFATPHLGC